MTGCRSCGEDLEPDDLCCAICGRPVVEAGADGRTRLHLHRATCRSCGAAVAWHGMEGEPRCAFCGQVTLVATAEAEVPVPAAIVPFEVDRAAAERKFREALTRASFAPGDLEQRALLSELRPVYVPYWDVRAEFTALWSADVPREQRLSERATPIFGGALVESRTEPPDLRQWLKAGGHWKPAQGTFDGHCQAVVPGSGALTAQETKALGPTDSRKAVPFTPERVGSLPIEDASVSRHAAWRAAVPRLEAAAESLWQCPAAYSESGNLHVNPRFHRVRTSTMLLPVWIIVYVYRGQRYRHILNGVTGAAHWEQPRSSWKMAGCAVVALAVLAALAYLFL